MRHSLGIELDQEAWVRAGGEWYREGTGGGNATARRKAGSQCALLPWAARKVAGAEGAVPAGGTCEGDKETASMVLRWDRGLCEHASAAVGPAAIQVFLESAPLLLAQVVHVRASKFRVLVCYASA